MQEVPIRVQCLEGVVIYHIYILIKIFAGLIVQGGSFTYCNVLDDITLILGAECYCTLGEGGNVIILHNDYLTNTLHNHIGVHHS